MVTFGVADNRRDDAAQQHSFSQSEMASGLFKEQRQPENYHPIYFKRG